MILDLYMKRIASTVESIGLFLQMPDEIAKEFPEKDKEDASPPHLTVLYIGDQDSKDLDNIIEICNDVIHTHDPIQITLEDLDFFTSSDTELENREIAHLPIKCDGMAKLRKDVWDTLEDAGYEIQDSHREYKPHATLAYCSDREYDGPVPTGSFLCTSIDVWKKGGNCIEKCFLKGH